MNLETFIYLWNIYELLELNVDTAFFIKPARSAGFSRIKKIPYQAHLFRMNIVRFPPKTTDLQKLRIFQKPETNSRTEQINQKLSINIVGIAGPVHFLSPVQDTTWQD